MFKAWNYCVCVCVCGDKFECELCAVQWFHQCLYLMIHIKSDEFVEKWYIIMHICIFFHMIYKIFHMYIYTCVHKTTISIRNQLLLLIYHICQSLSVFVIYFWLCYIILLYTIYIVQASKFIDTHQNLFSAKSYLWLHFFLLKNDNRFTKVFE